MNKKSVNRREFIKGAAVSSVAVSLLPKVALGSYRKNSKMRIGVMVPVSGASGISSWHSEERMWKFPLSAILMNR